jgi:site-specific recombinase XerD
MTGQRADDSSVVTLAVAGFLASCRSEHTRAAYEIDLAKFAAWCAGREELNLLAVDAEDIARYRTACESDGLSASTVARRLSAITSFNAYAQRQGIETVLPSATTVKRPTVEPRSDGIALSDDDAIALLAAADRTSKRSAVMIRLLMLDGLKVGEAVRADAKHVRRNQGRVTLEVPGRTVPTVFLQPETGAAIGRYLGRRREGPLLLNEQRGRVQERLTRFGIDYLVKEVARAAGIGAISSNTLRRRYIVTAHAHGADLDTIRQNAGHADQSTTRRYLDNDTRNRAGGAASGRDG